MEERHQVASAGLLAATPREPIFPWLFKNAGLYLLMTLLGTIISATTDGWIELGAGGVAYYWLLSALYVFIVGWALHLVVLSLSPADWPRRRARVLSILASPVILIVPMFGGAPLLSWGLVVAFGYGAFARLRQPG